MAAMAVLVSRAATALRAGGTSIPPRATKTTRIPTPSTDSHHTET